MRIPDEARVVGAVIIVIALLALWSYSNNELRSYLLEQQTKAAEAIE